MPRGRPKKYPPTYDKKQAYRERMKNAGYQHLTIDIPKDFKAAFDRLCADNEMTPREMMCVLISYYEEHEGKESHSDAPPVE